MTQQNLTETGKRIIETIDFIENFAKFETFDFSKFCPTSTHSFTLSTLTQLGYLKRLRRGFYERIKDKLITDPISLMEKISKINSDRSTKWYKKTNNFRPRKYKRRISEQEKDYAMSKLTDTENKQTRLEIQVERKTPNYQLGLIENAIHVLKSNGYRVQKKTEKWEDC